MMHLSIKIFLLLLFFQVNLALQAQNEPVPITISKEKVIIDGKTYFIHTIKQGETLFSISKAYNVSQKDIINLNKDAATSLRVGQTLKIPSEQMVKMPSSLDSNNYIYHIVEAGQTVYSIAEKYKLTKEIIYKYNPETEVSPLQTGQVVKIPKNAPADVKSPQFSSGSFKEHKVKRKETLYSISKEYNVKVDDIIAMNPELNTSDIKKDQVIKIPTLPNNTDTANKPTEIKQFEPKIVNFEPCSPNQEKAVHKVAFLLPLFLEENKTIADIDSVSGNKSWEDKLVYSRSRNPLEFYEGALLAIDSLKKAGNSYKVYVYDTGRDIQKLNSILNRKELSEMDMFIGPFDTMLLEKALVFAREKNIKIVSPLSQNTNLLRGNPNLFQVNPAETSKIDAAIQYLATQKDKNVIFYKSNRPGDRDITDLFEEKLNHLKYDGFQIKTHISNKDGALINKLVTDRENLIIMPSNEESAVADLLRNMNYINSKYKISVFGLSRWTTFSSIDISFMHNLQYEYYTSFYADYSKPVIKRFIEEMHNNFKTEPSSQSYSSQGYNYAFLGYDVTFYFLNALSKYGKNFENCLPSYQVDLIQSDFHFAPAENGNGTMNNIVNIIRYNRDFTITKVH